MMIKFWALIYRRTGWFAPAARLAACEYTLRNLARQYDGMDEEIALEMGAWESYNGFVREYKWKDL